MEPNTPNLKLKLPRLPKALGELAHSNQFLKVSAIAAYGLCLLMVVLSFFLARKQPLIFSFTSKAVPVELADLPKPEDEVIQAVKIYVEHRYKWEPKTVVQRLHEAEAFIQPQSRKAFEAATAEVSRFSIEKGVVQRAYLLQPPLVDLEKKAVLVSGDRVTAIQGLKAAGDLRLELSFESGPLTKENPWGVYVTKEKEE